MSLASSLHSLTVGRPLHSAIAVEQIRPLLEQHRVDGDSPDDQLYRSLSELIQHLEHHRDSLIQHVGNLAHPELMHAATTVGQLLRILAGEPYPAIVLLEEPAK